MSASSPPPRRPNPPDRKSSTHRRSGRSRPGVSAAHRPPTPPRGVHVVDLAVLYAELERSAKVSQAEIARRYHKSAGYVSVLCRLGRALQRLPPEVRDDLRVRHLTFKATQTIVSRCRDAGAILSAVRHLVSGRPPVRQARSTVGTPGSWDRELEASPHDDPLDPLPQPAVAVGTSGSSLEGAAEFRFRWDPAAARRDPARVLAEYETFLRATTAEVVMRLRRTIGDVGDLSASAASAGASAPLDLELSIRQLEDRAAATLRAHRAKMEEFLGERARRGGRQPLLAFEPVEVSGEEIDEDLK